MITAFVLAKVRRDAINETAEALLDVPGVSEVYSVAGPWDLAIVIRVRENEALADVVTGHLLKVGGITDSTTLIGFRAYSRHDLDRLFTVGFEEK
ncbi:MAG: Lrp/AsnC family transcriptional regulator [Candidatus Hydrogenedens sp.]|nr:Lrp/AsnC ligand binding domain-containing protein [Candidatus Hydrogenedentota bacterium]NLF56645.1 Lrp/AsnC family transcriptional regulator [Candidatus Hydrogenedens sp.]